jgi:hypothetical protein
MEKTEILTVATLLARYTEEAMVAPMVRFGRSLEPGGRFYVGAFGRNVPLVAVKMFPHFIYCKLINYNK